MTTVKQEFEKKQGTGALQKPASVGFVLDAADHAMAELKKLKAGPVDFQGALDEAFASVKGYVDRSFASFEKRIEALEAAHTTKKPVVRVKAGSAR